MINKIPLFKPCLTNDIHRSINDVLKSGWLSSGNVSVNVENEMKRLTNARYCTSVSSCTSGLEIILEYLNLTESEEIIIPTWTFVSVANVCSKTKAKLIFVDCDEHTFNLNITDLKMKITDKTRVIIFPEYGGLISDVEEIRSISKLNNIYVIEDCAHSIGAKYNEEFAGNIFDAASFSFYANKIIGGAEGGAITTNDKELYNFANQYRFNGMSNNAIERYKISGNSLYDVHYKGIKANLSDIHASLILPQLVDIENIKKQRTVLAENYNVLFSKCSYINIPLNSENRVWWNYQIVINNSKIDRNNLINYLKMQGIGTSIHFNPIHKYKVYNTNVILPVSEEMAQKVVSIPFYIGLSYKEQELVVKYIVNYIEENL
ncbi:DegT/DnrJ/EryC1/StrS aminotransferase family protein [Mammaliicoccus sciuri]|uniref:DegT/DnrJ/EryC1/StrS family aminotransferase n=1 Tax=Mammaliicoccus sciuri TaxID=1296 RepID=UPI0037B63CC3